MIDSGSQPIVVFFKLLRFLWAQLYNCLGQVETHVVTEQNPAAHAQMVLPQQESLPVLMATSLFVLMVCLLSAR